MMKSHFRPWYPLGIVDLVNQSVETEVEGGVIHRRQVLRSEVRRVYIQ